MAKSKRQREEPCYICGHYHDYEGGERCSTCGHVMQQAELNTHHCAAMPSQILPGFLYLGSYDHASRLELLKAMGVDHVLSLVPSCQELYRNTLTYHTVRGTPPDVDECLSFIDSVRVRQKRILVHCMTGVTKSPTVVIAYLMKLRQWTLAESIAWVKERHGSMALGPADAERLQQREVQLFGRSSVGDDGTGPPASAPSTQRQQQWQPQQWQVPAAASLGQQPGVLPSFGFVNGSQRSGGFVFTSGQQAAPRPDQTGMDI